jgi:hypothetical protein
MPQSCFPNVILKYEKPSTDGSESIIARALYPIKAGEVIRFNFYSGEHPLWNSSHMRLLNTPPNIICDCTLCESPSELNLYCGSIRCLSCERGCYVPPSGMRDEFRKSSKSKKEFIKKIEGLEWRCTNQECNGILPFKSILETELLSSHSYSSLLKKHIKQAGGDRLKIIETFIEHYEQNKLHPRHWIILKAKHEFITEMRRRIYVQSGIDMIKNRKYEDCWFRLSPYPKLFGIDMLLKYAKLVEYTDVCWHTMLRTRTMISTEFGKQYFDCDSINAS